MRRPIRVYADTSVFGGAFEPEFRKGSVMFFDQVREGHFRLIISALVEDEMAQAPQQVRDLFDEAAAAEGVTPVTPAAFELRDAYLAAGAVGAAQHADALHVAVATVSQCLFIVSWNFRHIVHYERIARYNAVNLESGYPPIGIFSPSEVIAYDEGE